MSISLTHFFIGTLFAHYTIMKIAVPEWQGRISPVLDVASKIVLVEIEDHRELQRQEDSSIPTNPWARAEALHQRGVEVLICGAVSWPLESALQSAQIQVVSNICGPIDAVLAAFRDGRLHETTFSMPGCCGRRRRLRGRNRRGQAWN